MPLTLQEVCINRLFTLSARNMQYLVDHWDLVSSLKLHGMLAAGSPEEQTMAAAHSAIEVYDTISAYLESEQRQMDAQDSAVISYVLNHDIFSKLTYMAKHGLSLKEGDLPI